MKKAFMFITLSGAVAVGNPETLNVQPFLIIIHTRVTDSSVTNLKHFVLAETTYLLTAG